MKKTALLCSAFLALFFLTAQAKKHQPEGGRLDTCMNEYGIANDGYDVVSYFEDGEPRHGKSEYSVKLDNGVTYLFSSQKNKDLFEKDPKRYMPQYGGFCSLGMSKNKMVKGDPDSWSIVHGKLYLTSSKKAGNQWKKDRSKCIKKANENWDERMEMQKKMHKKKDMKMDDDMMDDSKKKKMNEGMSEEQREQVMQMDHTGFE